MRAHHRASQVVTRRLCAGPLGWAIAILATMPLAARAQEPLPLGPTVPIPYGAVGLTPAPWQVVASDPGMGPWEPVKDEAVLTEEYRPEPANFSQRDLAAVPRTRDIIENVGIFGIGGAVRFGAGDPTNGAVTGRVGYKLNQSTAVSLRPTWVFGNNDQNGDPNNEESFRLPLTVDFNRRGFVSPYVGGGIATNTDSSGQTNAMVTGGLDLNVHENVVLGLNVNYIFQTDVNDTDWEAMTMLYLKF